MNNKLKNNDILVNESGINKKLNYYKLRWQNICKEAQITSDNPEYIFMEIVLEEISMIDKSKNKRKHRWLLEEKIIILVAFFNSVFSGMLSIWDNDMIKILFSALGVVASAFIAAVNSYKIWKSTKETWLRQSVYHTKLVLETDAFCDNIGKYRVLNDAKEKINLYKENINTYRKENYSNFHTNMGVKI